jgi:hypothetical protein
MSGLACEHCGGPTRVVDTRSTPHPDAPQAVRRAALAWGGREESWRCRRRVCPAGCPVQYSVEMPLSTLADLLALAQNGSAKGVVAALQREQEDA